MKRRHQVNHEPAVPGRPRENKRALYGAASLVLALGISGTLATPLMAGPDHSRAAGMEASAAALMDWEITSDAVHVDPYAPLAVFGGAGQVLDIDGRPSFMMKNAQRPGPAAPTEQLVGGPQAPGAQIRAENASTLLIGEVGQIGRLPGGLELLPPVKTRRISSPYGWRANPTGPGNQIHIGQDYPIACGSPVYASEDGIVTVSSWAGHSGKRITIDHGHNVQTGYSHNSVLIAAVGQRVKRGELIARSGTTGNSTGCHVHFEVIINGRWHDPRNYLPLNPGQAQAMVDSRRLTVSANSAPKGSKPSAPAKEQKPSKDTQDNPDVVVPEDDTPMVPKPSPAPTHQPPSKDKPSATPKPSATAKPSPTPTPTKPAKPTATATKEPSATPTQSGTATPTAPTPPSSVKPGAPSAQNGTATPPSQPQAPGAPGTPVKPSKDTAAPDTPAATPPAKAPATQKSPAADSPPAAEPSETARSGAAATEPDAVQEPETAARTPGRVDGE
ncbi:M23 family metallopeptidase [Glutamicibacter protophormiae]|uniref:M23 family metallopeptidase n=1 Tax=Glutamicibacter protophormiae TaxID=37930 RepID=UPI0019574E49|nr:M23 family metallopeptidase [Glutamicibacter protophormiae]QRQ80054.1 peptidoglycan DD-metalloendopeptidase family protein [Glutamicibacter protophormiae]